MWSVWDNVSMLYIRWVSDMFITWTLKHLQLQTFTVILAWSYYILVTSAAVQKLKIYSVQRLHVQLNRTWESNNGEIIYNSLTLALFLMFFYFSSSVIYYPNLVHATEGDHTTGKKLPPHTHRGPSFLQQPHASVIGNCFQEAGADRLGHTHGKAISTEQADYCSGFFLGLT